MECLEKTLNGYRLLLEIKKLECELHGSTIYFSKLYVMS